MKSNFLKLSYFAIAATGLLSACNQENISSDIVNPDKALTISVNPSDFIPVDAESRAVTADDLSSTTFENGDELGLFVISTNSDNMVYYDNVKFTYNGAQWTPEKDIYSYRYSKYVAYYPYNAELSLEDKTAAGITESIKNAFAASIPKDQSTADAFEKADLLLAEGVEADGAVTFDLKHQFSLVEIKFPVQKYITAKGYGDSQEKFTYNAPFVLSWYKDLKLDETKIIPFNAGKGVLRYIFNPGASNSIVIEGNVKYEEAPYSFGQKDAYTLNLTAGQYKRFKVTIEGFDESVETRDLEVGDYYYSDGSIYPYGNQSENDKNNPLVEGCIGVIYQVDDLTYTQNQTSPEAVVSKTAVVGVPDTEWIHGNVIALESLQDATMKWGAGSYSEGLSNQYSALNESSQMNLDLLVDMRGYELSHNEYFIDQEAVKSALGCDILTPSSSSGWYLPSAGQLVSFFVNLGGYTLDVNSNIFDGDTKQDPNKATAYTKIVNSFAKVSADLGQVNLWWTVTESTSTNQKKAWTFKFNGNNGDKTGLFDREKKTAWAVVRPVLSF